MKNSCRKRKGLKAKSAFCVCVLLFLLLAVFLYFHFVVGPMVAVVSRAQIDSVATTAISDAIFDVMQQKGYESSDFLEVKYSSDGLVSSVSTKSSSLNLFARDLSTEAQILLDKIPSSVKVPIGSFSGINALSAIGSKVNVNILPIGSIITSFSSDFDSVGINNTRFSLYVDVNASVSVVLPLSTQKIDFVTQVQICEFIAHNKVPNIYLAV